MNSKWDKRFMDTAKLVATWSSCCKTDRQIGAVIVRDKRIVTTGYNGACSGITSCRERGFCIRQRENIPSGTRLEKCYAVHAEENAIAQAARLGVSVNEATLYCTHQPCVICAKMMINSGIKRVVYGEGYPDAFAMELFAEAGIKVDRFVEEE